MIYKNINVVIIQPNEPFGNIYLPESIIDIATILKTSGVNVKVIDTKLHNLSVEQTVNILRRINLDILCITGLNCSYRYIKDLCIEFKRFFPEIPIVAGGHFIMSIPETILSKVPIDIACTGEGDEIIVELIERLYNKEPLDNINNIAYKFNDRIIKNEFKLVEDIDKNPLPAYELFDMDIYLNQEQPAHYPANYIPIVTGRGCLYHCYYCGNNYKKNRRVSPEKLLRNMDLLNEKFGIKAFLLSEENVFNPKKWTIDFCKLLISSGKNYEFAAVGCAQDIDEEIVEALSKANCTMIGCGAEHWNPNIQKAFYRKLHSDHLFNAWNILKKYKMNITPFNILWGHPLDSVRSYKKSYKKSIHIIEKYKLNLFSLQTLVIYPNSKLTEDALSMKKILDYEDYMYSLGGYAPHVNLTKEDDDRYRSFIRKIELKDEIQLDLFLYLLLSLKIFNVEGFNLKFLIKYYKKVILYLKKIIILNILIMLPKFFRKSYRNILEKILTVPMYDKNKKYYHQLNCFKEILDIPEGKKVIIDFKSIRSLRILHMILNSISESKLEIIGFLLDKNLKKSIDNSNINIEKVYSDAIDTDSNGQKKIFKYPLITSDKLENDYYFIYLNGENDVPLLNRVKNNFPDMKIIAVKNPKLKGGWALKGLNGVRYNNKMWIYKVENDSIVRALPSRV